jgi:hypothetical protein
LDRIRIVDPIVINANPTGMPTQIYYHPTGVDCSTPVIPATCILITTSSGMLLTEFSLPTTGQTGSWSFSAVGYQITPITDSFSYRVVDTEGNLSTLTYTATLYQGSTIVPPLARDQTTIVPEDGSVSITFPFGTVN